MNTFGNQISHIMHWHIAPLVSQRYVKRKKNDTWRVYRSYKEKLVSSSEEQDVKTKGSKAVETSKLEGGMHVSA